MLGDLMEPDQRRALFECGKRPNGIHYTCNDQSLGFPCVASAGTLDKAMRAESSIGKGGGRRHRSRDKDVIEALGGRRHSAIDVTSRSKKSASAAVDAVVANADDDAANGERSKLNTSSGSTGGKKSKKNKLKKESTASEKAAVDSDNATDNDVDDDDQPCDKPMKRSSRGKGRKKTALSQTADV